MCIAVLSSGSGFHFPIWSFWLHFGFSILVRTGCVPLCSLIWICVSACAPASIIMFTVGISIAVWHCLVPVLLSQSIVSSNRRDVFPYLIPHWFPVSPTFLFLLSNCPLLLLMCLRFTLPKEIVSHMYVSSYILCWIFGFSSLVQTLLSSIVGIL